MENYHRCMVVVFLVFGTLLSGYFFSNINLTRTIHRANIYNNTNKYFARDKHLLILFTSFGYDQNREIVYKNTMTNWQLLGPDIKPVLFIDNASLATDFRKSGWDVYPLKYVLTDGHKLPVLKKMFAEIQHKYNSSFIGFSNADILFSGDLKVTLDIIKQSKLNLGSKNMLITGRRTDVNNVGNLSASNFDINLKIARSNGKLHPPYGLDLFISNHNYPWFNIPELVIGKPRFDNWIVIHARRNGYVIIDVTKTVLMIHQTVDAGWLKQKKKNKNDINMNMLKLYYKNISLGVGTAKCTTHYTEIINKHMVIHRKDTPDSCNRNYTYKFANNS